MKVLLISLFLFFIKNTEQRLLKASKALVGDLDESVLLNPSNHKVKKGRRSLKNKPVYDKNGRKLLFESSWDAEEKRHK